MITSALRYRFVALTILVFLVTRATLAQTTQPDWTEGQGVDVYRGSAWVAATLEKREGRRFQVKYLDDEKEEWVAGDHLRQPGQGGDAPPPSVKPGRDNAKPDKPARNKFEVGDTLDGKWGGLVRAAKVVNKRVGDWYLVKWDNGNTMEWVEWWRLRKAGASDDIPSGGPNGWYNRGDEPPRPDAGDGPNSKKPGDKPGESKPFGDEVTFTHPITPADVSAVNFVTPSFPGPWAVPLDATDAKATVTTTPIPLKSGSSHGHTSQMFHSGSSALLVVRDEFADNSKSATIERINLQAGNTSGTMPFDVASVPMALSPSGKRALGRSSGFGFGKHGRLDVWTIGTAKVDHVISFYPQDVEKYEGDRRDVDLISADLIDDTHAYTMQAGGLLMVWDLEHAKAIWKTTLDPRSRVELSPGRKYLFGTSANHLVAFDALAGTCVGMIDGGRAIVNSIDVSPDGTRLVGVSDLIVTIYDLQSGQFLGDVGLPEGVKTGDVVALPDHYALIGTQLMNLDKRTLVWLYDDTLDAFSAGGKVFNVWLNKGHAMLVNGKLPHDAAKKADGMSLAVGQTLLKPGDRVALDVTIEAPAERAAKLKDDLTTQIIKAGLTIDPAAPVHIVARTQNGNTYTEHFAFWAAGPFSAGTPVSVTDKISSVSVETNGKAAWVTQVMNRPTSVSVRMDQTIASAVGAADTFNLDFFDNVRLPTYVLKPTDKIGFGESDWALGGVKDVPPGSKADKNDPNRPNRLPRP